MARKTRGRTRRRGAVPAGTKVDRMPVADYEIVDDAARNAANKSLEPVAAKAPDPYSERNRPPEERIRDLEAELGAYYDEERRQEDLAREGRRITREQIARQRVETSITWDHVRESNKETRALREEAARLSMVQGERDELAGRCRALGDRVTFLEEQLSKVRQRGRVAEAIRKSARSRRR